jgi:SAM-dependent methyltransferase
VREFYESFWADAPADPEPYAFKQRRALLLGEVKPGERVLDLGCGAGRFLTALKDAGAHAVGAEIADAAAERARATGAEVRLVEPDGTLPFGHGEFDLVWCSEVLEHIPDVGQALFEIRRVLRRGGRLLLTEPYHGRIQAAAIALTRFETHFDPLGQHVRFFTAGSLRAALDASGFAAIDVRPSGGVPLVRRMLVGCASRPGPREPS